MKKKAFTLIELLVVISIIVLLMALLFPALSRARKQARAVVCRTHLRQWGTVLSLYLEENEGRFPRTYDFLGALSMLRGVLIESPNTSTIAPSGAIPNVETKGIACCPMATRTTGNPAYIMNSSGETYLQLNSGGTFAAWEIVLPTPAFKGSFGLNRHVFSLTFEGMEASRAMQRDYTEMATIRDRGRIPLALDAGSAICGVWLDTSGPPATEPNAVKGTTCINRHNGAINGLFLDWSVRPIGLKELWTLKWHLQFDTAGPWTKAGGALPEDWPEWMRQFQDY